MVDENSYTQLFHALVGDADVHDLVTSAADAEAVAGAIRPLRDRRDLDIVSLAVNGARVDVVARSGDLEWRVVFGAVDGTRLDWLSVFARPPDFAGVPGGRAVIVNGPSSAGKSSVLREIRSRSNLPWVVFDEPMFGTVDIEYLIWRERADVLHRGFLDGIAALARAGNCVALAAGGHPQATFDAAFAGVSTVLVGLDCDVAELARRERGRTDVPGGLAESSLHVHDGWLYDMRFDTSSTTSGEIAVAVLGAFER